MIAFDDQTEIIIEFEHEAQEDPQPSKLEELSEKVHRWWLLAALWWIIQLFFVKFLFAFLVYVGKGLRSTAERMWKRFTVALAEAFGKMIGWIIALVLVAALAMSFTANGYSLSKTFSWEGITTLYQTWK